MIKEDLKEIKAETKAIKKLTKAYKKYIKAKKKFEEEFYSTDGIYTTDQLEEAVDKFFIKLPSSDVEGAEDMVVPAVDNPSEVVVSYNPENTTMSIPGIDLTVDPDVDFGE